MRAISHEHISAHRVDIAPHDMRAFRSRREQAQALPESYVQECAPGYLAPGIVKQSPEIRPSLRHALASECARGKLAPVPSKVKLQHDARLGRAGRILSYRRALLPPKKIVPPRACALPLPL